MTYITIDGFEHLTEQQCFNMAAAHILKTKKKSVYNNRCVYYGSGCAASVFMKPEYHTLISSSWDSLAYSKKVPNTNQRLISRLQNAHDMSSLDMFMPNWLERMRILAELFNLDPSILDTTP